MFRLLARKGALAERTLDRSATPRGDGRTAGQVTWRAEPERHLAADDALRSGPTKSSRQLTNRDQGTSAGAIVAWLLPAIAGGWPSETVLQRALLQAPGLLKVLTGVKDCADLDR